MKLQLLVVLLILGPEIPKKSPFQYRMYKALGNIEHETLYSNLPVNYTNIPKYRIRLEYKLLYLYKLHYNVYHSMFHILHFHHIHMSLCDGDTFDKIFDFHLYQHMKSLIFDLFCSKFFRVSFQMSFKIKISFKQYSQNYIKISNVKS